MDFVVKEFNMFKIVFTYLLWIIVIFIVSFYGTKFLYNYFNSIANQQPISVIKNGSVEQILLESRFEAFKTGLLKGQKSRLKINSIAVGKTCKGLTNGTIVFKGWSDNGVCDLWRKNNENTR